jgi:hypothetical protein
MKWSEIFEGWKNDILPSEKLRELINQTSEDRLAICKTCIAYDEKGEGCALPLTAPCCNKHVKIDGFQGCGCPLQKKTKCLSCSCPANKWLAVSTPQQEELLNNKLNK